LRGPSKIEEQANLEMKNKALLLLILVMLATGCAPMRRPVPAGTIPTPPLLTQDDEQYGHDVLSVLSEQYELDQNDKRIDRARGIVNRLTKAIGANKDPWHVYVFKDPTLKNAAAARGNHVFIWSGMMDSLPNDDELSVVIAHEVAHVLADHPSESDGEASASLISQIAAAVAQVAVLQSGAHTSVADMTGQLTEGTLNGLMVNPESQRKELEADVIGLHLLAEAGIDPTLALKFWEKNLNNPDFSSSLPQFFSSHPSSEERLEEVRANLPAAVERYKKSKNPTW